MNRGSRPCRIASVVEGHSEVESLVPLLWRVQAQYAPDVWADFVQPYRVGRDSLIKTGGVESAVDEVLRRNAGVGGVLVLIDADDDCPATLGPDLLRRTEAARPDVLSAVVVAKREFEAWFLAAARSLRGVHGLPGDLEPPADPEQPRDCKKWLIDRMPPGRGYHERRDQAGLAAAFDLDEARVAAPSFDKFCRDVLYLLTGKRGA